MFHAALRQFQDQSLEVASNFLLNFYELTLRSNSLFDGPLRVDPTLDKDIPVEIQ